MNGTKTKRLHASYQLDEVIKIMKSVFTTGLSRLIRVAKRIFFYGNRFYCPCCDGNFRAMQPYKGSFYIRGVLVDAYTKNAICPNCGSHMRYRFILEFLKKHTDIVTRKIKLLHVAPEKQMSDFFKKQKNIEYFAGDIDPSRYANAVELDMTNIHFPADSFDVIVCSHVLEHIQKDEQAIREMYRVTKTGGWAVVVVPIYDEDFEDTCLDYVGREKMYGIGDHKRLNSAARLRLKLNNAGFNVRVYSFDDIPGNYVDRTAKSLYVASDRYLFFCTK